MSFVRGLLILSFLLALQGCESPPPNYWLEKYDEATGWSRVANFFGYWDNYKACEETRAYFEGKPDDQTYRCVKG